VTIPAGAARAGVARLRTLAGATLRANPALELVPVESPGAVRREREDAVPGSPEYVGVLRPRAHRWIGVRAAGAPVAELFRALARPRTVPRAVLERLGADADRELARLVLDGVLEIETGSGFAFGADAWSACFHPSGAEPAPRGVIGRLSLAAIHYAVGLPIDDTERLAARLYFFNRHPVTPWWRQRLPSVAATARFLGMERGAARETLERHWRCVHESRYSDEWSNWIPRSGGDLTPRGAHVFKLFVSPDPRYAAEALHLLIETASPIGAPAFKFGCGVYSLLRPDKFVLYFSRKRDMEECARTLCRALEGVPAHAVPFSAEIGPGGIVSWGVDVPDAIQLLDWRGTESWRFWITSRLARAIIIARHARGSGVPPATFALDRLSLDDVDVATWTPLAA
jgi:hypothetical protein